MQNAVQVSRQSLIAFAAAPLIAALLFVGISGFDGAFSLGAGEILLSALLMYIGALSLEVVLALPSYLVLGHLGYIRWWTALVVGLAVGYIGGMIIGTAAAPVLRGNAPIAIIGALSGLGFWLLARKATPNTSP